MFALSISRRFGHGLLALVLSACASFASAQTYHVEIDTSSFGSFSSSGWVDMQFNPGNAGFAAASVSLSDFSGAFDSGSVSGLTPQLSGGASGSLAGGYQIANSTSFNDVFNAVNFGGKISFDVSFSGAVAPSDQVVQSIFSVAAYGADQATALGNASPDGSLMAFSWTPAVSAGRNGTVGITVFDPANAAVSAVPEVPVWLLMFAGVALVGFCARRRESAGQAIIA
jgi:hypothetical protein